MKSVFRSVAILGFVILTPLLLAQNSGPAANGDFLFDAGGMAKSLTFDARIQNNGQTRGEMVLSGGEALPDQDVDGGGDSNPGGTHADLSLSATFDCLTISGNRAVMSGEVTDSSVGAYIGLRVVLVVEDGGEGGKKAGDRYTWGVYRAAALSWVASDAELTFDPGVGLTWIATDAEREDDIGIPSHPSNNGINCQSFPLESYTLEEVPHGAGNIQVKP